MSYSIPFFVYLVTGNAIFLLRQERRSYFPVRLLAAMALLLPAVSFLTTFSGQPLYSALSFLGSLALSALTIKLLFVIDWSDTVFCAVAGYTTQHIYSQVSWLYLSYRHPFPPLLNDAIRQLLFILICIIVYRAFGKQMKGGHALTSSRLPSLALLSVAVLVEILIADMIRLYSHIQYDPFYYRAATLVNLMCSVCILTIQFNLIRQKSLTEQLAVISQMRLSEQQQYQISKDTVQLINVKCHDMRHQIRSIGQHSRMDPKAIQELESVIGIYDALLKTGNQALDVILAEKSLFCQKNGIVISCIADGQHLSFMSDSDIYSFFGNLLDNAIQAVLPLPEEQRIIGLSVRREQNMLSIHSHNYYAGQLKLEYGLPRTTKADTDLHGFGVQSMKMIAEKYGGVISFEPKDGIFNLNLLIPRV